MAQEDLLYRIVVKDDGSAVLEKFSQNVGKASEQSSGMFNGIASAAGKISGVAIGVAAGFYALNKVWSKTVVAAAESEQAVAKLSNALMNQGVYSKSVTNDLTKYASSLSMVTGVSDESIISMQSLLATYGVAATRIREATRVSLDFAAATGTDLNTAALLVGKASQGMTDTLKRYGIVLDDNIPKNEKFNQVLEKMNQQFGGRARADAETFAGSLNMLANSASEVGEAIGGIVTTASASRGFMREWSTINQSVATSINSITNAIATGDDTGLISFQDAWRKIDKSVEGASVSMKLLKEAQEIALEKMKEYKKTNPFAGMGNVADWNKQIEEKKKSQEGFIWNAATGGWEKANKEWLTESEELAAFVQNGRDADLAYAKTLALEKEEIRQNEIDREKNKYEQMLRDEEQYQEEKRAKMEQAVAAMEITNEKTQKTIELEERKRTVIQESASMLGVAAQLSAMYAAKNFALQKSFAIAEAVISGAVAVQRALASPPGGMFGIAMAAIISAKTAANIALIAGTKPGGAGGGGGGGAGGGLGGAGGGFPAVPETPARAVPNVNISVSGFVGDEAKLASELGRVVREAVGDGVSFGLQASTS